LGEFESLTDLGLGGCGEPAAEALFGDVAALQEADRFAGEGEPTAGLGERGADRAQVVVADPGQGVFGEVDGHACGSNSEGEQPARRGAQVDGWLFATDGLADADLAHCGFSSQSWCVMRRRCRPGGDGVSVGEQATAVVEDHDAVA
jgi:hypothetical protein